MVALLRNTDCLPILVAYADPILATTDKTTLSNFGSTLNHRWSQYCANGCKIVNSNGPELHSYMGIKPINNRE